MLLLRSELDPNELSSRFSFDLVGLEAVFRDDALSSEEYLELLGGFESGMTNNWSIRLMVNFRLL